MSAPDAAKGHYKDTISFVQRSLLRPWRVERIIQRWTGREWVVVSRTKVRRGR